MNAKSEWPQGARIALAITVVLAGCAHPWCYAESLLKVYQKARTQDAQYLAARKTLQASLEKIPQARAGLLPAVNLTAGKSRQFGVASFSESDYVDREVQSWSWSAQITQPLIRWANWVGYQQADALTLQATEQFSQAEQDLILRVAQAYLDVVVADQSTKVLQAQLRAFEEQLGLAQRTYAVGTGTITDVHEAKAKWALSQAQSVAAVNELTTKKAELEKILGELPAIPAVGLTKDLPELRDTQLDEWLVSAATHNAQVRVQKAALEAAHKEVAKSQAAHMPTLDLVLSRSANYSSGSMGSPADLSTLVSANQAGLQLNIPLFAGGATQSKVREALALEDKARDELTFANRNAASQVRQAFAGVVNGQAQVSALRVAVEAGRNAVESNKIGFRIGTRINPDVLNAEQQLYATLRDLAKARLEVAMQGLKLKAAAGLLVQEDLAQLDRMLEPQAAVASVEPDSHTQ